MGLFLFGDRTERRPQVASVASRARGRLDPAMLGKAGCRACPMDALASRLVSPKMPPTGSRNPVLMVLGEAPGVEEDKGDEQFIGQSGVLARASLRRALQLREGDDENNFIRWNNAIRCHPAKNRDPTMVELACCMPKQLNDIADCRPPVILTFGAVALESLLGDDNLKISAWRGRQIAFEHEGFKTWVVPTFHPAYILRTGNNSGFSKEERQQRDMRRFFDRDIDMAVGLSRYGSPPTEIVSPTNVYDNVTTLRRYSDIIAALRKFKGGKWATTDIETTGLRPYQNNAAILTASLCDGKDTISFPICHREAGFSKSEQRQIFDEYRLALLSSKEVWAHNLVFELEWLCWQYGLEFVHKLNSHDTMCQAYILDERGGGLGLDDLCRIYFGIRIKELTELDKSRMAEEPLSRILPYGGIDSKMTAKCAKLQFELLRSESLDGVYEQHRKTTVAIAIMQRLGVVPDFKVADELDVKYEAEERHVVDKIMAHDDVKDFVVRHGEFNPNAPKSVSMFFGRFLGYPEAENSADEKVLKTIDHPVAEDILKMREYKKLRSTYIRPLQSEIISAAGITIRERGKNVHDDGLIHTKFNMLLTTTGRLSSDTPNMQNMPIREHPEVRGLITSDIKEIRDAFVKEIAGLYPYICSADYGQIEARVIGMASKDEVFCKALREDYDVHMEWAERIAHRVPRLIGGKKNLTDKATMKAFRSVIKNKWTFPLFYRASLFKVELALGCNQNELGQDYNDFWRQFTGVRDWQDTELDFYDKNGYVTCLTGHRRHGPMTPNMIVNSPIQGTASHIVVDAMKRLSAYAVETGELYFHPRLNVHDDLTFYLPEDKLEECIDRIAGTMVRCDFAFINVPLTVEVKVGRNWGAMREIVTLRTGDYQ